MKILYTANDLGVKHFDTAPCYGVGYSEEILGRFLKTDCARSGDVTVTTKFGLGAQGRKLLPAHVALMCNYLRKSLKGADYQTTQSGDISYEIASEQLKPVITKKDVERSFLASRKALRREFIDYFLLHESRPLALQDDAFEWLCKMRDNGSIGKIGVASNYLLILQITPAEMEGWDVLQYEFVPEVSETIFAKFPSKLHINHSCMKWLVSSFAAENKIESVAGLLKHVIQNTHCKHVLFATRNADRVKSNLIGINRG